MKRLLLISRCPPYPIHLGDRLIIWHLARELARRGYAIDLIAFAQRASDWDEIDAYRAHFQQVTLLEEPARTPLMYLRRALLRHERYPQDADQAWAGNLWQAVAQHLAAQSYDVVHVFGGVQVYEIAPLLADQAALITPYESFSLYLQRLLQQEGGVTHWVNYRMARHYESWLYDRYSDIVVLTEIDKAELLRLNPALTVHVIPNGIDLDYFTGGPDIDARDPATLLFIGNYDYPPNVDAAQFLAYDVMPIVREALPSARLQLVGNAPPPALQTLNLKHIEVTGRVPDVRPYLAQATAFAAPLRVGAGLKNKVLEALAMHIPTVATPISVDGIDVTHDESVLVASPALFAGAAVRLLRDRLLQRKLARNGRAIIEARYSWERVADQYEALYQQLDARTTR